LLLEFGFENFFSFKEETTISFKLDSNCPTKISNGKKFSTILGIKGANASGKSHVLKALAFIKHFCCDSFAHKPEEEIEIESFYGNSAPSFFYAEFELKKISYLYELTLTREKVISEVIYRRKTKNGKKTKIIDRQFDRVETISEFKNLKAIKLRKNSSIISTSHQYEINELDEIYNFFSKIGFNVHNTGLNETPIDMVEVSAHLNKDQNALKFVTDIIVQCDTGVSSIEIKKVKSKENETVHIPIFNHKVNNEIMPVIEFAESSGTKALFRNLPYYYYALTNGGTLIMDEFDIHLHPHILPKIIELFLDPNTNKNDAQLLFSTHDTELLNLLGRYRTYIVNKINNESFCYRLDEIQGDLLRNDRPIAPSYNDGKIGGIPKI
jgi:uncharacterized protein